MEKIKKYVYKIAIILVVSAAIVTFYNIFILHNYMISLEVPCDPNTESCFVIECDPSVVEDCSITPPEYYKLLQRKASDSMICGSDNFECLSCRKDEINCMTTMCDPTQEENICDNI